MHVSNDSNDTLISGTSDNDTIYVRGNYVTVTGDAGDDYLVSFDGDYSDSDNYVGNVTIYGGKGKDTVKGWGYPGFIDGGDDDDYLYASGENLTVNGGAGNDEIITYGKYTSIYGGSGNDSIEVTSIGDYSTVRGGIGNDTLKLTYADNISIQYASGDGNDVVEGFDSNDTLKITSGTYVKSDSGDDLIVSVGSGSITFKGMAGKSINIDGTGTSSSVETTTSSANEGKYISDSSNYTLISGTSNDDSIYVRGSYVTANGGDGDDELISFDSTLSSYEGYVTLNGGNGKDTIYSWGHPGFINGGNGADYLYAGDDNITISGGVGDDEIITYGNYTSINADSGNDEIRITSIGDYSTVMGSTGNDTLSLALADNILVQYASGDGNDLIEGFDSNDTIKITGGTYSKSNSGNDLVLTVGNGSIRFKDMAGGAINIIGTLLGGSSVQETVKSEPSSLTVDDELQKQSDEQVNQTIIYNIYNVTVNNNESTTNITDIDIHNESNTTVNNIHNESNTNITDIDIVDIDTTNVTVQNTMIINKSISNTYIYNGGGNRIIQNYQQGEVVQLENDYQGIGLNGNSFFVYSSSGSLEIQNSRNKFIGYSASNSEVLVYSYLGGSGGAIDGRGKSQIEMMIGADHVDNQIYAGSGGSSLWGGNGGSDVLSGGDGYDEFFYAIGSGNDVVQNSSSNDVVNLVGVSLEQITGIDVNTSYVNVNFYDGGNLKVEGNTGIGYKVGEAVYACNQATGEWYNK